jgi:hypothetical protein
LFVPIFPPKQLWGFRGGKGFVLRGRLFHREGVYAGPGGSCQRR